MPSLMATGTPGVTVKLIVMTLEKPFIWVFWLLNLGPAGLPKLSMKKVEFVAELMLSVVMGEKVPGTNARLVPLTKKAKTSLNVPGVTMGGAEAGYSSEPKTKENVAYRP